MYAEFEVHRTMICDRVRTEAFRRAIDSVVRPGDVVLDVGAGSGILSVLAARAGAARVYAVERTSAAVLAQELAAANGVAGIVQVIHGDVMDAGPLRSPVDLTPGMAVRARVRTALARPAGTWTSWAIALPGAGWEEHDEQAVWEEIDD